MKNRIDFLLEKAKFNLTSKEKEKFKHDLFEFRQTLKILNNFNLNEIEPLIFPFEKENNYLREDIIEFSVDNIKLNSLMIKNSVNEKDGYIFLKKEKDNV